MNPVPEPVVGAYVAGRIDAAEAVRLEQYLAVSGEARLQVGAAATAVIDPARLEATWLAIDVVIDPPRRPLVERVVTALGFPADLARLMAATPAMRRSWYLAIVGAILFGLAAAGPNRQGGGSELLFLVLAPLIPVMGVALAYGPGVDPAHEVTVAAPLSGFRLVLARVVGVLVVSMACGGIGALLLERREGLMAAAWLLPAFGLSMACLALTTWVRPKTAGWAVGGAWLLVATTVSNRAADQLALFRGPGQVALLLVGLAGLVVTVARREAFDLARVG